MREIPLIWTDGCEVTDSVDSKCADIDSDLDGLYKLVVAHDVDVAVTLASSSDVAIATSPVVDDLVFCQLIFQYVRDM